MTTVSPFRRKEIHRLHGIGMAAARAACGQDICQDRPDDGAYGKNMVRV